MVVVDANQSNISRMGSSFFDGEENTLGQVSDGGCFDFLARYLLDEFWIVDEDGLGKRIY